MRRFTMPAGLISSAVLVGVLLWTSGMPAQTGAPQEPANAAAEGKTAGQSFQNIQVLKDIPAGQLVPTMQFVATSLGVGCTFCHVQGKFPADDKPEKKTARQMMLMVLAINKANFNGRLQVTCYTCHRGSSDPVSVPPVLAEGMQPPARQEAAEAPGQQPPPSDQVLEKYVDAMGGADALAKITTRVEKGTATSATGQANPVEIYIKAPDERVMITHTANGDRISGYNGDKILASGGRGGPEGDAQAAQLEDDLYLASNVKKLYTQWRASRPAKIGDRDVFVLNGSADGLPSIRLYIDQQNGTLLRMVHFTETGLGRLQSEVDYADYRNVDGVQVPFRLTFATATSRTTIQLDQVQQNVPVDDSKFAPPAKATAER